MKLIFTKNHSIKYRLLDDNQNTRQEKERNIIHLIRDYGQLILSRSVICLLIIILNGCAYSFVDQDGRRNTVGMVWIISDPLPVAGIAGDFLEVTTVGLSMASLPTHSSAALGYNREVTWAINNNSCIVGDIGSVMKE